MLALIQEHTIRLRIAYYQLALDSVHPGHPDVPDIVRHIYRLQLRLMEIRKRFAA